MAIEARRGCGFRKVGGLYLVGERNSGHCGLLPLPLVVCPTCGGGIKQTRGWTWIDPTALFPEPSCDADCSRCPIAADRIGERAGLLWIGASFYRTPEHFLVESNQLGVCRRIAALPRGFEVGTHWVFLAHPTACSTPEKKIPGVFSVFRPRAVEQIVTETEAKDELAMAKLRKRGITPVAVPDDDPDHRGSVHDKATSE